MDGLSTEDLHYGTYPFRGANLKKHGERRHSERGSFHYDRQRAFLCGLSPVSSAAGYLPDPDSIGSGVACARDALFQEHQRDRHRFLFDSSGARR